MSSHPRAQSASPDRPKLSILIPTYNRAGMLRECLESALGAPLSAEIVVLDNASDDDTPEVIAAFERRDPRVRSIRHAENVGPLANFQCALAEARGETICLTGDDDLFLPGCFQKKLALLDRNPGVGLVYSQWHRIDETGRSQGVVLWPGVLDYSYTGGRDEFRDLLPASYMMFQSVVFRRELYDRYGGFDETPETLVGNDWDLLLRYCYHTTTAFIAEPLVAVRVHAQSFSESVGRREGKFAPGRIGIWRRWLVEHDDPPVLDEAMWRRLAQAFLPDLQYEFGQDAVKINRFLGQLEEIKRDNRAKIARLSATRPVLDRGVDWPRSERRVEEDHAKAQRRKEERQSSEIIGSARAESEPGTESPMPPAASGAAGAAHPHDRRGQENAGGAASVAWTSPAASLGGRAEDERAILAAIEAAGFSAVSAPRLNASAGARGSEPAASTGAPSAASRTAGLRAPSLRFMVSDIQEPNRSGSAGNGAAGIVHVCHTDPPDYRRWTDSGVNVGRAVATIDRVPDEWAEACAAMDEIWTPSQFSRAAFARAGVDERKLAVVPSPIPSPEFNPTGERLHVPGTRGYNFLSVFRWASRSGWDVLVRAYVEEFAPDEDVALILKTCPEGNGENRAGHVGQELLAYLREELGRQPDSIPDIVIEGAPLPDGHMGSLYRAANAFVLASHGERWCRSILEAMATGLPVITTDWGNATEYLTVETGYPVNAEARPASAISGAPPLAVASWAAPDIGHLRAQMRRVYTARGEAREMGLRGRSYLLETCSPEAVAARIAERLASWARQGRAAA